MVSVLVAYCLRPKVEGACSENTIVEVANQLVIMVQKPLEMVDIVCIQSGCPSSKNA